MNTHKQFLNFNGKTLYFIAVNGQYYIAYKPICEALNIDANRCYKNLKKHKILGAALANLPMQVEHNGILQSRMMTCIPEKYIYFWIATLNSDDADLLKFQMKCYDILFNHFRGSIIGRKELLKRKIEIETAITIAEKGLQDNENYQTIVELKKEQSVIIKNLKNNDKQIIENELTLFNY